MKQKTHSIISIFFSTLLLVSCSKKSRYDNNAIVDAVVNQNLRKVSLLLKNGYDVNAKDNSDVPLLVLACENYDSRIVSLILSDGANINAVDKNSKNSLMVLASLPNFPKSNFMDFLKYDPDISRQDKNGETALFYALKSRNNHLIKILLSNGANIECENKNGVTPLIFARHMNSKKAIEIIVAFAKLHGISLSDWTDLMKAANTGDLVKVNDLMANGAKVDYCDAFGETPLFRAVKKSSPEIILSLLRNGADVNHKNRDGNTPLIFSVRCSSDDICEILLAHGAQMLANSFGENALDYAKFCNRSHIVQMLVSAKSKARTHPKMTQPELKR